ncbi:MAG TPA: hypothetical protein VFU88_01205 [Ktedonobacterales bacterium]|nr:hypothetical protein [Ktedonobacterales bacterium]
MHRVVRILALTAGWLLGGGLAFLFYSLGFECWDACPADYATARLMRLTAFLLPGLLVGMCTSLASAGLLATHARWQAVVATLLVPALASAAALPLLPLAAGGLPLSPAAIADDMLLWTALVQLMLMTVPRRILTQPAKVIGSPS